MCAMACFFGKRFVKNDANLLKTGKLFFVGSYSGGHEKEEAFSIVRANSSKRRKMEEGIRKGTGQQSGNCPLKCRRETGDCFRL